MKIAACFAEESVDCHDSVKKMVQAQRLYPDQHDKSFAVSGGALGYVSTGDRFSSISLERQSLEGNLLMISGVPIDMDGELDRKLAKLVEGDYLEAIEILKKLDGAYVAVFWDEQNKKLAVVTDVLGLQPLYLTRQRGRLLLASELKAFPAGGLMDVVMDPAGWGAFVGLSFTIGNHTQLAGVHWGEAAMVMIYDPVSDTLEKSSYWSWPAPKRDIKLGDIDTGQMIQIMHREIKGYTDHCSKGTLLFSGGFDSRLILSLLHEARIDVQAFILSHRDELFGLDGKLALRVARQMNIQDIDYVPSSGEFYNSSSYLRYLIMNEVSIPSLNLFIAQLAGYISAERQAVWEGIAPGFGFSPAYPKPGGFDEYIQDRCIPRDAMNWQAVFSVFASPMAENMYDGFQELLKQERGKYSDDEFGVAQFQMKNQMAHRLALNPFKVLANAVLPLTPGLSKSFWDMAVGLPLETMIAGKLYRELFQRHFPDMLKIPVCSGTKIYTNETFHPDIWMLEKFSYFCKKSQYYSRQVRKLPICRLLAGYLSKSMLTTRKDNQLVDFVICSINPDHPDLNTNFVAALQKRNSPYDWPTLLARNTLFYWQIWRWILQGELNIKNVDDFLTQDKH